MIEASVLLSPAEGIQVIEASVLLSPVDGIQMIEANKVSLWYEWLNNY